MTSPEANFNPSEQVYTLVEPTADQLRALEEGPGMVTIPAQMTEINEDTWLGVNFAANFNADPESFSSNLRRQTPVFQRLQILYPDFSSALDRPDGARNHTQEELRQAYRIMAQLVDQNDPYVMHDGKVDPAYLLH